MLATSISPLRHVTIPHALDVPPGPNFEGRLIQRVTHRIWNPVSGFFCHRWTLLRQGISQRATHAIDASRNVAVLGQFIQEAQAYFTSPTIDPTRNRWEVIKGEVIRRSTTSFLVGGTLELFKALDKMAIRSALTNPLGVLGAVLLSIPACRLFAQAPGVGYKLMLAGAALAAFPMLGANLALLSWEFLSSGLRGILSFFPANLIYGIAEGSNEEFISMMATAKALEYSALAPVANVAVCTAVMVGSPLVKALWHQVKDTSFVQKSMRYPVAIAQGMQQYVLTPTANLAHKLLTPPVHAVTTLASKAIEKATSSVFSICKFNPKSSWSLAAKLKKRVIRDVGSNALASILACQPAEGPAACGSQALKGVNFVMTKASAERLLPKCEWYPALIGCIGAATSVIGIMQLGEILPEGTAPYAWLGLQTAYIANHLRQE